MANQIMPTRPLVNTPQLLTCYVNVVLQILRQLQPYFTELRTHPHRDAVDLVRCVKCKLWEVLQEMASGGPIAYEPMPIFTAIVNLGPGNEYSIYLGQQWDSWSVVYFLVNECKLGAFARQVCDDQGVVSDGGTCFEISMDPDDDEVRSTQRLMNTHTRETYWSPSQPKLHETPEILWMHMLRFHQKIEGKQIIEGKLKTSVIVSEEIILRQHNKVITYDVVGTVNHEGDSINEGHFLTYVKTLSGYDEISDADPIVTKTTPERGDIYMVFYRRRPATEDSSDEEDISNLNSSNNCKCKPTAPSANSSAQCDKNASNEKAKRTRTHPRNPKRSKRNPKTTSDARPAPSHSPPPSTNQPKKRFRKPDKTAPSHPNPNGESNTYRADNVIRDDDHFNDLAMNMEYSRVKSIARKWKLYMFIPKRVAGEGFVDKFENLGRNTQGTGIDLVFYTISYDTDEFLDSLLSDPELQNTLCYEMDLCKGLGEKSIYKWLGKIFIAHILHTRYVPARNGVKFEFVFRWELRCLVTKVLMEEYDEIKKYAREIAKTLNNEIMFCIVDCRRTCRITERPHHLNLQYMNPKTFNDVLYDQTLMESYKLRWTTGDLSQHPLKSLFEFENIEDDTKNFAIEIENVFEKVDGLMHERRFKTVYVILIATALNGQMISAKDLANGYANKTISIQTYTGKTIEKGYRKGHFKSGKGPGTSVYKALRKNSTAFLVFSEEFEANYASLLEAAWIELLGLSAKSDKLLHKFIRNKSTNKRSEYSHYFPVDNSIHSDIVDFVKRGFNLYSFMNANGVVNCHEGFFPGSNVITDNDKIFINDYERSLLPEVKKLHNEVIEFVIQNNPLISFMNEGGITNHFHGMFTGGYNVKDEDEIYNLSRK